MTSASALYLQAYVLPGTYSSSSILRYVWSISTSSSNSEIVYSSSVDPRVLRLPADFFNSLVTYTVTVTVSSDYTSNTNNSSSGSSSSSTASVEVFVAEATLTAVITGGSQREVAVDKALLLDASLSVDSSGATARRRLEMIADSTTARRRLGVALSFEWLCTVASGVDYGSDCSSIPVTLSLQQSILDIAPDTLTPDVAYLFTVVVTSGDQASSASVLVQVVTAGAPTVELTASVTRVQPAGLLSLEGIIQATYNTTASWNVSSVGTSSVGVKFKIDDIAVTPTERVFALSVARPSIGFSLGIDTSSLTPGATYLFTLYVSPLATISGHSSPRSSASVSVIVNLPPAAGYLNVAPIIGSALNTSFTLTSAGWVIEVGGYPLLYSFQYQLTPSSEVLVIGSRGLKNIVSTPLPGGLPSQDMSIVLLNEVTDSFGASSTTSTFVKVLTPSSGLADDLLARLKLSLDSSIVSGDSDSTLQAVNAVASSFRYPAFTAGTLPFLHFTLFDGVVATSGVTSPLATCHCCMTHPSKPCARLLAR
jgi:hypothetical protein